MLDKRILEGPSGHCIFYRPLNFELRAFPELVPVKSSSRKSLRLLKCNSILKQTRRREMRGFVVEEEEIPDPYKESCRRVTFAYRRAMLSV